MQKLGEPKRCGGLHMDAYHFNVYSLTGARKCSHPLVVNGVNDGEFGQIIIKPLPFAPLHAHQNFFYQIVAIRNVHTARRLQQKIAVADRRQMRTRNMHLGFGGDVDTESAEGLFQTIRQACARRDIAEIDIQTGQCPGDFRPDAREDRVRPHQLNRAHHLD